MYNSVLVSLIGSLSLRCECLHEWSSACVLHTYRSHHSHYFTGFEIFRNYVRDEPSSFSTRRSGRFSLAAGISSKQLKDALRRAASAVYKYERSFTVESAAVFSASSRQRCHINFLSAIEFSICIRAPCH